MFFFLHAEMTGGSLHHIEDEQGWLGKQIEEGGTTSSVLPAVAFVLSLQTKAVLAIAAILHMEALPPSMYGYHLCPELQRGTHRHLCCNVVPYRFVLSCLTLTIGFDKTTQTDLWAGYLLYVRRTLFPFVWRVCFIALPCVIITKKKWHLFSANCSFDCPLIQRTYTCLHLRRNRQRWVRGSSWSPVTVSYGITTGMYKVTPFTSIQLYLYLHRQLRNKKVLFVITEDC